MRVESRTLVVPVSRPAVTPPVWSAVCAVNRLTVSCCRLGGHFNSASSQDFKFSCAKVRVRGKRPAEESRRFFFFFLLLEGVGVPAANGERRTSVVHARVASGGGEGILKMKMIKKKKKPPRTEIRRRNVEIINVVNKNK